MVLDLWERLRPIFCSGGGQQPEINLENLSAPTMQATIDYLLQNSKEVQTAFYTLASKSRVYVGSPGEATSKLAAGELAGGFLIEPRFFGVSLPTLGVFSDALGYLSIDYETGKHWTPIALMALFEFFRMVKEMDNSVIIQLDQHYFGRRWQFRFTKTLREYLHEPHQ